MYERADGSRVKIEPVLEIDSFDNDAFQWSYIVYHAAPGQEKFEDVAPEHLQVKACGRDLYSKISKAWV